MRRQFGQRRFVALRLRISTHFGQGGAGDLYADGHYESAVAEAFKSIEVRVRALSGLQGSGAQLMAAAFKTDRPLLDVAAHKGRSGQDEREGFLHIFRGTMIGIRNPGAHELFRSGDPKEALEYLGLASLLHRRIDAAELVGPRMAPNGEHEPPDEMVRK